jgi:hypothetical protein
MTYNKNEKRKKADERQEVSIFGRRSFVTGAAATAALTILKHNPKVSYDRWAFLIDPNAKPIPNIPKEELRASYPALGPVIDIEPGTQEYKKFETLLLPILQKSVLEKKLIKGEYELKADKRFYCLPAKENIALAARDYCRDAYDFLLESLPELKRHDVRWTPVIKEDDFSRDYDKRVFLGHASYEIANARLTSKQDDTQTLDYVETSSDEGGNFTSKWSRDRSDFDYWFACVPASGNLVLALYSELLFLYVAKGSAEQLASGKPMESRYASEAITEAAARIIAEKAVERFDVPDGIHHINTLSGTYLRNDVYKFVGQATDWMRKNGVSEGFKVWKQEGPDGFMARIRYK